MLIFSVSFQFYRMIAEANPKNAATKNLLHFSICACHPCAGAMLIFPVSFQFYRMIAEANPKNAAAKNLLHFSICACHPCAGAMLIFSVSFQFYRMIESSWPNKTSCKRPKKFFWTEKEESERKRKRTSKTSFFLLAGFKVPTNLSNQPSFLKCSGSVALRAPVVDTEVIFSRNLQKACFLLQCKESVS